MDVDSQPPTKIDISGDATATFRAKMNAEQSQDKNTTYEGSAEVDFSYYNPFEFAEQTPFIHASKQGDSVKNNYSEGSTDQIP